MVGVGDEGGGGGDGHLPGEENGQDSWKAEGPGAICLGDVTPQWGRSEPSKGQQWLGLLQRWGASYLWLAVECSFAECAKQTGAKWLKICLLGLCLKQLDPSKFEFGSGGLFSR